MSAVPHKREWGWQNWIIVALLLLPIRIICRQQQQQQKQRLGCSVVTDSPVSELQTVKGYFSFILLVHSKLSKGPDSCCHLSRTQADKTAVIWMVCYQWYREARTLKDVPARKASIWNRPVNLSSRFVTKAHHMITPKEVQLLQVPEGGTGNIWAALPVCGLYPQ